MAASKQLRSAEKSKAKPSATRKPPNAGKGRKAGVPNKTTALLKEAILAAAASCGSDGKGKRGLEGYCAWLAREEPKAFAALLGRVLPLQIASDPANPGSVIFQTVYEQRPGD
ncbi:hypothetical protein LOC51_00575 [Rubrivivax sp. JA1024]|nr:hypothetical protein [Rubrivivax sp. JA1024]